MVGGAVGASRRYPVGDVRFAAGLPVCISGCVDPVFGQHPGGVGFCGCGRGVDVEVAIVGVGGCGWFVDLVLVRQGTGADFADPISVSAGGVIGILGFFAGGGG